MTSTYIPILELQELEIGYKVFGGRLDVVDSIDFKLFHGERVGLVGETGSGKTTTMKSIMQILPIPPAVISKGKIFFEGTNLLQLNSREMREIRGKKISMIFQDPTAALNPVFTVGQQIKSVIKHSVKDKTGSSKINYKDIAIDALKAVSLADPERLLNSYPLQLSGGMRQRICIAMALITKPNILVADEPGTSLDVTIQDQVLRLLDDLVEDNKTSVVLITHSLGVVRERTNRVYVMYAGNIVEIAKTKDLFDQPLHPYTVALLRAIPKLTGGGINQGVPGRMPSYLNPPNGCRFHTRCPHVMDICKKEKPPLYNLHSDHFCACHLLG